MDCKTACDSNSVCTYLGLLAEYDTTTTGSICVAFHHVVKAGTATVAATGCLEGCFVQTLTMQRHHNISHPSLWISVDTTLNVWNYFVLLSLLGDRLECFCGNHYQPILIIRHFYFNMYKVDIKTACDSNNIYNYLGHLEQCDTTTTMFYLCGISPGSLRLVQLKVV